MAQSIGITLDGIKYHIKNMTKQGLIKQEGPTKAGKWKMDNNQIEREKGVVHNIERSFITCIDCRAHENTSAKNQNRDKTVHCECPC